MRRARLTQFQAFIGCSSLFAIFATSVGCEPDLDTLSANHGTLPGSGGTSGKGGSSASGASGGSTGAEGGEPNIPDTCFDKERSANESDKDCGGTSECRRCDLGEVCTANSDCAIDYCRSQRCTEPACDDKVQNQNETDVDCGGICRSVSKCAEGKHCEENKDCDSGFCDEGTCGSHCLSGKQDSDETGVDCGGPTCDPCENGQGCELPEDCKTELCLEDVCVDPSCDDNIKNHGETDVDCGGPCAVESGQRCDLEEACEIASDCDSFVCTDNECVADPWDASDEIDTMEDFDLIIKAQEGRTGLWYNFQDTNPGKNSFGNENVVPKRGSASGRAMHTVGDGHDQWGAGFGFDFYKETEQTFPSPHQSSKIGYDASAYRGISFWGRADIAGTVKVVFPDSATERSMTEDCNAPTAMCDKHLITTVNLTSEWQKFTILWDVLSPEQDTPDHQALIETELVSIQFRFASPGAPFDYWIDDIIFLPDLP